MRSLNPCDSAGSLVAFEAIPDGGFAEVEAVVDGEPESLLLFRNGEQVRAWLNICPHAGRRLDWSPGQFLRSKAGDLVCAAHGASFSLDDGLCVAGPCKGESLRSVGVAIVEGQVVLA